jgi:hypothetical protein
MNFPSLPADDAKTMEGSSCRKKPCPHNQITEQTAANLQQKELKNPDRKQQIPGISHDGRSWI